MNSSVVIFEKDSSVVKIMQAHLKDFDEVIIDKVYSDYNKGFKYVKENKPKIVLFSITSDRVLCSKMIGKLSEFGINVIALSEDYTTSNIIQTLRWGAKDFVSKPIIKKDLIVAITKCCQDDIKVLKKSQIITIFSNKGGIGKTAIAVNLAYELSKQVRDKVALIDLNLPIGDIPTFLDIRPSIDISEIANNIRQNNFLNISDTCCRYKDSDLYVLAEPLHLEEARNISVNQVKTLFDSLRNNFSYIIVDMGSNVNKLNSAILKHSDRILLTTVVNLPQIRNCQRCLDLFKNIDIPDKNVKIVLNRYLENDEITVDDVEKALNKAVYWKIPNNYFTMMSSINKGIPVSEINENSNITDSFSKLASKIADDMFEQDLL